MIVDSAVMFNYLCDGTTPASAVLKDGSAVYTPGLSERRGTTSKFYHGDALGSTRGITNASQTVTDSVLYDGSGMVVSRTGTTPTPFGFVGKGQYQTDNDSGLQLLGYRYYDASVGRFISSDPAKAGDNWYACCNNNPFKKVDPSGEDGWALAGGIAFGAVVFGLGAGFLLTMVAAFEVCTYISYYWEHSQILPSEAWGLAPDRWANPSTDTIGRLNCRPVFLPFRKTGLNQYEAHRPKRETALQSIACCGSGLTRTYLMPSAG